MITHKHLDQFTLALDEGRFYDAHEVLEEIWFPSRFIDSNEVKLLKGFINAAVCFELVKKGRKLPSQRAWLSYLKYRQLLFKTKTKINNLNIYYKISLHIDKTRKIISI